MKAPRQSDKLKIPRQGVQGGSPSWLQQYKLLVSKPKDAVTSGKMSIDIFLKWLKAFHLLQPIKNAKFQQALVARLQKDGCPLNLEMLGKPCPITNKAKDPTKNTISFMQCSCGLYRSYLWCIHTACWACEQGLITGPPPTLDPTPMASVDALRWAAWNISGFP